MVLNPRARRVVLLALAVICIAWTAGMPLLGQKLYPAGKPQPHGAKKYLFYCHVV
jgi:hypothetical protein